MQLLRNLLLIDSKIKNTTITVNGMELFIETKFGEGEHFATFGTIKEVGVKVKDMRAGDIAYFTYIHAYNAKDRGTMIDGHILTTDDTILCYIRDGKLHVRDNVLIVHPSQEKITTNLIVPDGAKKILRTEGKVLASFDEEQYPVGSIVNYSEFSWRPFEYELHSKLFPKLNTVSVKASEVNFVYPIAL